MGKRKAFLFYGTVQRLFFIAARSEGNKNGHGRRPAVNIMKNSSKAAIFYSFIKTGMAVRQKTS